MVTVQGGLQPHVLDARVAVPLRYSIDLRSLELSQASKSSFSSSPSSSCATSSARESTQCVGRGRAEVMAVGEIAAA
jgi:hypothetical protein